MNVAATICSGMGAPEAAMPHWHWSFGSEIEKAPCAVLKHRHGMKDARLSHDGPALWGDFTTIRARHLLRLGIALPSFIIAGTPCQAFSIAGGRMSLDDARGNLTMEFLRLAHSFRRAGSLAGFLWENVSGILSMQDNAFGCFLAGIVGADAPFVSSLKRGRWPVSGMVDGPYGKAAWTVKDAQFFGVAQRRERVFVVASFVDWLDPAAVLFERIGMHGNPAPRRETGEGIAGTLSARTEGGGGLGTDFELAGGLQPVQAFGGGNRSGPVDQAAYLTAKGQRIDFEVETFITHTLRGEGFDANEDGTGRGTPLVPVAFAIQERAVSENLDHGPQGKGWQEGVAYTLEARNKVQAVAFDLRGRENGSQFEGPHDTANIRAASGGSSRSYVMDQWAVRRLTPTECERLQGFPDGFTAIPYKRRKITADEAEQCALGGAAVWQEGNQWFTDCMADGPRYKMIGNSQAVPCIRWILERVERQTPKPEGKSDHGLR